jgi:hypothetical protein
MDYHNTTFQNHIWDSACVSPYSEMYRAATARYEAADNIHFNVILC